MQPPLPNGTILQNRYRLLGVLGQGGFGRTYLAEDQGRFSERCALKEFIPAQVGDQRILEKAKELFQREAATLYQINHPQVPQFRATFEDDQRLFLVQDYVQGKTYREILDDRAVQGLAFSEAETVQLLRQLLPVLMHLHSKGIIHRDIAPDNIILRQTDNLPVLIDFGVVKELATRVQATTAPQYTTVGKMGYAPGEQMQTGQAYPNSDLYALAVTAVVLLTGREPRDLYDDRALTWHWQRWAKVSPGFQQILNRMLSYRPGDRYQSAAEVLQALQALGGASTVAPGSAPPAATAAPTYTSPAPPQPTLSNAPTVAVGQRYEPPTAGSYRSTPTAPAPLPSRDRSVWENPWAVVLICLALAGVTGIASWAVVSAILNAPQETETIASPTETPTSTPTNTASPTATPTSEPVEYSQRLNLAAGDSNTVEGNLKANETIRYVVSAEQGQILTASVADEGVLMTVFAPNRQPADDRAERTRNWEGTLGYTGDYVIQLRPVRGVSESDYQLTLDLQAAAEPEPEPTPTEPEPTPTDEPEEPAVELEVLQFPPGSTGLQVSNQINPGIIRQYVVQASADQVLSAEVLSGAVSLNIYSPNGRLIEDAADVLFWQGQLVRSGEYVIEVVANDQDFFTLDVRVENPE